MVLRRGYHVPFSLPPPLSPDLISLPSYSPSSPKGVALREEVVPPHLPIQVFTVAYLLFGRQQSGLLETCDRLVPSKWVRSSDPFQDGDQPVVLQSVRRGDWMVFIDLKDVYLQVPVHPDSCRFLQFVVDGQVYQFRALCFGLSTARQGFTGVMAPVSLILHRMGVRLLHYLYDWLILASSHQEDLQERDSVLCPCC